ncbi:MAG: cyclic lactone autoinducer peptide [Lachnospiraceae bacterium]|nr:cyclic lactone autoinducer peptide [Lachnospiraceae bacterium]
MKKSKNTIEKIVSKVAYKVAESNVNSNCTLFFYQPIVPEKVKVLKKKNV